jgi:hypothetical protein
MILPLQAPPIIRSGPHRWVQIGNKLCPVVRTDRDYREIDTPNPNPARPVEVQYDG